MDDALREARRRWERSPDDVEATDAYARAARRGGLPLPLELLERRRLPARRLHVDLAVDVGAELEDGDDVALGVPSPREPHDLELPSCREWWFHPEGVAFDRLVELAREHGAPHLEAVVPPRRYSIDGLAARSLSVNGMARRDWARVARLPALERLEVRSGRLAEGLELPGTLAALGVARLGQDGLRTIASGPPLTSLGVGALESDLSLERLRVVEALRGLEALGLGHSWSAEEDLPHLAACTALRRLSLGDSRHQTDAFASAIGSLERLEHLSLRYGLKLTDAGLDALVRLRLGSLRVEGAVGLSDDAFAALSRCASLQRLWVDAQRAPTQQARLSDDGLARLELPALRHLRLRCSSLTGAGLRPDALPELRHLHLALSSAAAAERVSRLPRLEHLTSPLDAETLAPLAGSTTLRSLETSVPATAAEALGQLLAAGVVEELVLAVQRITPALVAALARGVRLRRLVVRSALHTPSPTDVSPLEALERLEDLAIMGQPVLSTSWTRLAHLERLRVVRHDRGDSEALPALRAALPAIHVLPRVPAGRPRQLRP